MARGYLNQPELTRERFVPDPFAVDEAQCLYRTGDVVKFFFPTAALNSLGAPMAQAKICCFRIEPGEIEAVLKRHPGLKDAVVLAREEEPGQRRLAGLPCPLKTANRHRIGQPYLRASSPTT